MTREEDDDERRHHRSTRDVDEGATRPRDADGDGVRGRPVTMEEATKRTMDANDEDATKNESDGREREDADDDATDEKDDDDRDARATPAKPRDRARRSDLSADAASEDARYRTVFVGGVHHECDEERLREFFEKAHGEVESVKMIYDRMTSARKGYGFVKFREGGVADAVRALEKVTIEGKAVDVKEATRDEPVAAIVGGGRSQGAVSYTHLTLPTKA